MIIAFKYIIPILIIFIITYGAIKGVRIYEVFIDGAKEGMQTCMRIFPYLLAMIFSVSLIRDVGLLDALTGFFTPLTNLIGLPSEVLPLVLIKPFSGSGALGVFTEIINQYGPDSLIGITASLIMGSTETIFYTVSIYFGAAGITKVRHALVAALIADFTAVIAAVTIAPLVMTLLI